VRMPEGFSDLFAQIKQHQIKEEGQRPFADAVKEEMERIKAEEATILGNTGGASAAADPSPPPPPKDDFESRRSPFSRVATVFSTSVRDCVVDGRGRLVLSLHRTGRDWASFFNSSPALIAAARATQAHYRGLKLRERQVAEALGISDLFCEPSLLLGGPVGTLTDADGQPFPPDQTHDLGNSPSPAYQRFLEGAHRDAHQMAVLRRSFPRANEISIRIHTVHPLEMESEDGATSSSASSLPPARECFSVDPQLGLLLAPLHASVADIRDAILERGQECVQIAARAREEADLHAQALLHAKRHLKLRALTVSASVSREQAMECAQRLSRVFGSMREHLHNSQLHIDNRFSCSEEDGRLSIPWNWG